MGNGDGAGITHSRYRAVGNKIYFFKHPAGPHGWGKDPGIPPASGTDGVTYRVIWYDEDAGGTVETQSRSGLTREDRREGSVAARGLLISPPVSVVLVIFLTP